MAPPKESEYSEILVFCHDSSYSLAPFFATKYEEIKLQFEDGFFLRKLVDQVRLKKFMLSFPSESPTEYSLFMKIGFGVDKKYSKEIVATLNSEFKLLGPYEGYSSLVSKYDPTVPLGYYLHNRKEKWQKRRHARGLPVEPKETSDEGLDQRSPKGSDHIVKPASFSSFLDIDSENGNASNKKSSRTNNNMPAFTRMLSTKKQGGSKNTHKSTKPSSSKSISNVDTQVGVLNHSQVQAEIVQPSRSQEHTTLEIILQAVVSMKDEIKSLKESLRVSERRQRYSCDTISELREDVKILTANLKAQSELISKVVSRNVSKKETLTRKLPFSDQIEFEEFFEHQSNRQNLTEFISAITTPTEDFTAQVFTRVMTRSLTSKYIWPSKRGNHAKIGSQTFPSSFISWYESLITITLLPQPWFNTIEHMRKLRKYITNARYVTEKSSKVAQMQPSPKRQKQHLPAGIYSKKTIKSYFGFR